jgi:hypothetical protein
MKDPAYIVVEMAGYVGENDRCRFPEYLQAVAWMRQHYTDEEIQNLHVDIAFENADGDRTYEY